MSYDVLEQKFRALPQQSFDEVSAFFDYILYKFGQRNEKVEDDEQIDESLVAKINAACKKAPLGTVAQDATIAAMWEAVKNDSW